MSTANSVSRPARFPRRLPLAFVAGAFALLAAVSSLIVGQLPAGAAPTLQTSGSSFAALAIDDWVAEASTLYGINVNFQVSSSVLGLNAFAVNEDDFGASDIPYSSGQANNTPSFPYEYMPDVAGGLAFMYNLKGNDGNRISNLILSAHVVDEIFLGEIVWWDSPDIAALNPQLAGDLPHTQITPVYRQDASGENYLLSDYMLHEDASNYTAAATTFQAFNPSSPNATWPTPSSSINLGNAPFPGTYPGWAASNLQGQNGASNAANYVAASTSNGSITYVETAYAQLHSIPVASLVNTSGKAVQPTAENVSTALEAAILHPDLTQDLTNVYTNPLPNAYPLSAYSYLVTPCSPSLASAQGSNCAADPNGAASSFSSAKGAELGQFVAYLACAGQGNMGTGYSPLPPNLVQQDFYAIGRLNGGVEPPPVSSATCKNPYVDGQLVLPGEPVVIGEAGGGITSTTVGAAATAAGAQSSAAAAAAAAAAAGKGASGGSGKLAGGASGKAGAAGSKGLTAAQIAQGYTVVDGQIVQKSKCEGVKRFLCANQLASASLKVPGIPLPDLLGWLGAALVLFVGVPFLGMALVGLPLPGSKRRRSKRNQPDATNPRSSGRQGDGRS